MIISIDGIDGSFKNTNTRRLSNYLQYNKYKVFTISFPNYDSVIGKEIIEYMKKDQIDKEYLSNLFLSDMEYEYKNTIRRYQLNDHITICDRYIYSNYLYQYQPDEYQKFISNIPIIPIPDISIFMKFTNKSTIEKVLSDRRSKEDNPNDANEDKLDYLFDINNSIPERLRYINHSILIELEDQFGLKSENHIFHEILLGIRKLGYGYIL